jgi:hypothetical protein
MNTDGFGTQLFTATEFKGLPPRRAARTDPHLVISRKAVKALNISSLARLPGRAYVLFGPGD